MCDCKWRDIETAPKMPEDDFVKLGKRIILGFAKDEEGYDLPSCEGYWRPALGPGENGRSYDAGWVSTLDPHPQRPYIQPTHWMPLPSPPVTPEGNKETIPHE